MGLRKIFFYIAPIAQFFSDFKTNGTKLFKRAIPYRKIQKKIGIHHIRWGEPLEFQPTPKKIVDMKVEGLPPLMWWIPFFFGIFL